MTLCLRSRCRFPTDICVSRNDDRVLLNSTVNYNVLRNFALTFDYQYTNLDSNLSGYSYQRNVYTLGGTYKY